MVFPFVYPEAELLRVIAGQIQARPARHTPAALLAGFTKKHVSFRAFPRKKRCFFAAGLTAALRRA
jgi:hypothetical protein